MILKPGDTQTSLSLSPLSNLLTTIQATLQSQLPRLQHQRKKKREKKTIAVCPKPKQFSPHFSI